MKKRRIVLILAAACTLSLIGCNGSYGGNMDQTSKTQGTQSPETGTEPQSAADTESDLETNSAVGTESDSEKMRLPAQSRALSEQSLRKAPCG